MNDLLTRGVEKIYPSKEALEKELATGRKLKIYFGIDPTGPTLHLGHAVNLLKLKDFQAAGHEVIILIGDFTAMIGDPTDRQGARVQLSAEQVKKNLKNYQEQIGQILDLKKTTFRFNSEWLAKLNFEQVLTLAAEFTAGQMLERDMFQERLKNNRPIYLHELLYPLMQGYDSVALEVDLEIGGNDQTFNMLVGRTMLKSRDREKFVLTTKLLTDPQGKKMGKTEGNLVAFTDQPEEMYGKIMSWPDPLLPLGFEICTRLAETGTISLIEKEPKQAKMKLAREITSLLTDEKTAQAAEESFVKIFQKKEIPQNPTAIKVQIGDNLAEVLIRAEVVKSKAEFHRLAEAGAIYDLDSNEKIQDLNFTSKTPLTLKIGKRRFVKITF